MESESESMFREVGENAGDVGEPKELAKRAGGSDDEGFEDIPGAEIIMKDV